MKLDPKGYFLIRTKDNKIEIALCKYQDKEGWYDKHNIKETKSSDDNEVLLDWAKGLGINDGHCNYLKKELERAKKCIKEGKEYIQK